MDLTLFLSQVFGVYILVAGLSGVLYPDRARRAMEEVTRSYIIPYFDGALALIFGLLVVLTHNVWEGVPAIIITLIGWLAVLEGVAMLLLPQDSLKNLMQHFSARSTVMGWSVVALLLGAYLVYAGFFA